ncbi:MAG: hypothetical protein P4N59_13185 [Negativicutes bacterium]|nr:hypothetical protein [Negativicutes bacterium]
MSDTANTAPSQTYSDDGAGKEARNITTRFFLSKGEIRRLDRNVPAVHWAGEIMGVVYGSQRKETPSMNANGEVGAPMVSYQLIGEFEGTKYSTGEVARAGSCYLPTYFAETIHALIQGNKDNTGLQFWVEVGMEVLPEEKVRGAIDVAWTVRHKMKTSPAESPLAALKRIGQSQGVATRLPAPPKVQAMIAADAEIPGDTGDAETVETPVHAPAGKRVGGAAKAA